MKTFSRVAIATLTMVGTAAAQPAPAPAPAKDAKPADKAAPAPAKDAKPAPAAPPAADPKLAPKPAAPPATDPKLAPKPAAPPATDPKLAPKPAAPPATDPKLAPKAAVPPATDPKLAPKPAAPPVSTDPKLAPKAAVPPASTEKPQPPPEPPLPPEIEAMAKTAVGTWKCKGDEFDEKGTKVGPITGTNKVKLELDNWWLSETLEVKGLRTVKLMAFSTYDTRSKKWRRVALMNRGGQMIGTSDGQKDSKLTWNMDLISPMGAGLFRDSQDASDPKVGLKVWGEYSLDKGKSWLKAYEMICKK